jgi:glyoxylase-like metal-dependent hydrolase (beta-lactamase superfamily II)/rhodanese-related sulfurtransferase
MIFDQLSVGGCQSYVVGCPETFSGALIDPEIQLIDRYRAVAAREGLTIRHVIDTHTHADHFSASRQIAAALHIPVVMHRDSPAPFVDLRLDDGNTLIVGNLRLTALHTPGHTRDSMCLVAGDRVFTGDTLLIGGTGRTDLPSGDPEALYESLFAKLLKLDPALMVFPAHDYKARGHSTIGAELADNPRLKKKERAEFIDMMRHLNLSAPTHLTEALRINISGAKSVSQLLAEASRAVPFVGLAELNAQIGRHLNDLVVLDVREKDAFAAGHIPTARNLPRGQLELRVDEEFPDPSVRIAVYCEFGKISTLAAATLRDLGFLRASALDGGMKAWRDSGLPIEKK